MGIILELDEFNITVGCGPDGRLITEMIWNDDWYASAYVESYGRGYEFRGAYGMNPVPIDCHECSKDDDCGIDHDIEACGFLDEPEDHSSTIPDPPLKKKKTLRDMHDVDDEIKAYEDREKA